MIPWCCLELPFSVTCLFGFRSFTLMRQKSQLIQWSTIPPRCSLWFSEAHYGPGVDIEKSLGLQICRSIPSSQQCFHTLSSFELKANQNRLGSQSSPHPNKTVIPKHEHPHVYSSLDACYISISMKLLAFTGAFTLNSQFCESYQMQKVNVNIKLYKNSFLPFMLLQLFPWNACSLTAISQCFPCYHVKTDFWLR